MFGNKAKRKAFNHEVDVEIEILRKTHGDGAAQVAREKAARPTNRTARGKVLAEAARRLGDEPQPRRTLVERLFG